MQRIFCLLALLAAAALCGTQSMAQPYPVKPIRITVGFPVGTLVDVVSRALAVHMQKELGQPLVVDVRPGAGGFIAVNTAARSDPDGYTIHFGLLSSLIPAMVKNNSVDARKELGPISDILEAPFVLLSSAKFPFTSFSELLAYAKASPEGKLNLGSSGANQPMMMQLVRNTTGLTYTVIYYQGGPAVLPAMLTGEVALNLGALGPFIPHVDSGAIRVLFVTGPKRLSMLPNVPTAAEVGIPALGEAVSEIGFWGPRGMPKAVVDKLNRAAVAAVRAPEIAELFAKQGYQAVGSTPEEQLRRYEARFQFWTETARITNFQPQ